MFFEALLVCRDVRNRTYYVVVISNLAVTLISYLYAMSVMGSMMNLTQMMR